MENPINAVLIDTSAFHNRQCDFAGITSEMIPMFLRLLESNHIPILSHPVLDNEIRKHIKESQIVERTREFCRHVKKCKGILAAIGYLPEEILEKADPKITEGSILKAYESFKKNFYMLPYVEAHEIFEDYFNTKPPFSATGDKKSEFPDAFVLKSLLKYCDSNPESHVLVITDDKDWENTLSEKQSIIIVKTLKEGLSFLWQQLGNKTEFITQIWGPMIPQIMKEISSKAESEAYRVDDIYDFDDIEISRVHTTNMIGNMTPLEITNNSALIQVSASLEVDGMIEYLDETRSQWDKEDKCYYFVAYTRLQFYGASAEVECEVRLNFPSDGSITPVDIESVRITNKYDICLDTSEAETTEEDITDYCEDDWRTE